MKNKNNHMLKEIGERIRYLRVKKGLSQEELASRAGVHRTYVGMIERGEKNATIVSIHKIAVALSISIPEIFQNEKEK